MSLRLRKFVVSLTLIVALMVAGSLVAAYLHATRPMPERTGEPPLPPVVELHTLHTEDVPEFFTGYGSARADRRTVVTSEVTGLITEVAQGLEDGSPVEDGQLLVRIDDREYGHQLARAESLALDAQARIDQLDVEETNIQHLAAIAQHEVDVNRGELQRLSGLFEQEQASKREFDFANLEYQRSRRLLQEYKNQQALLEPRRAALWASRDARRAEAALAALNVDRCRIKAPYSGQVERIVVDIGARVQPGSEILSMIATRFIEVPIELPASVRPYVTAQASCSLESATMPGLHWSGRISRIAPIADAQTRTFAVYVVVDNETEDNPLVPGYFLTAKIAGPIWRNALAVPRHAVLGDHLFVANGAVAHRRPVHVDRLVGNRALVSGQVSAGDQVILTNLDKLFDGAEIRTTPVTAGSDDADRDESIIVGGRP